MRFMSELDTRTRLLEASYTLMLARGYPATSVAEICERAGASKGSFYDFFGSKQELAQEMLELRHGRRREMIEGGLDRTATDGAEYAIRYVQHIGQGPAKVARGAIGVAAELSETLRELRDRSPGSSRPGGLLRDDL